MKIKRKLLPQLLVNFVLIHTFFIHSFAQDYSGYSIGSWAGINSLHVNPANVVDSRYKVDINLYALNIDIANNIMGINQSGIFSGEIGQAGWDTVHLVRYYNQTNDNRFAYVNLRVQGPSFMFNITKKDALAFTSNVRAIVNVDNLPNNLTQTIFEGIPSSVYGQVFGSEYTNANVNAWAEYGLTYGRVILDNKEHFLKAGVTLKLLQGLGAAYANGRNYTLIFGQDTLRQLTGNINYGHSDNLDVPFPNSPFAFKFEGPGFGADLGIVYEWRPKWQKYKYNMDGKTDLWRRDVEKYLIKVGLSLVDIGSTFYTRYANSRDLNANVYNLPNSYFDGMQSYYDFTQKLVNMPGMTVIDPNQTQFGMELPLALITSVDVQPAKGFFINFTPHIALNQGQSDNNRVHSTSNLGMTIRYENPWFGAYMPVSYNFASQFNWGISLRLGPLFFGSHNIFSNLIAGTWKSFNYHLGLKVPIPHGHPRDRDNDQVSDKKDKCPDVPGLWEFLGCPDTDRDGIQDSQDDCPTEPGIAEFKGCPDTDGDGLPDKNDKCPTDAGPKELQGCPDRDFDGVIDREDDCPDDKGLPQFNGCPDTDGDGLIDKLDQCPTLPGPKEQFGCPDTDGDGIYDHEDQCPTEKGLAELRGCPYADTDKDGIRDIDDKCPDVPGPIENGGCPYADTDKDGVIDLEDKCPTTPGVRENFGCPPITEKEKEVLRKAFENLEFATGKSIIKTSSYDELDDLANLLKEKKDWKLLIEGHTDNVGKRESNITLSKNRANAVKTYLVKKGVSASRFVVKWYGPDKPIDTNDTEEGRQRNRRVEMTLIQD